MSDLSAVATETLTVPASVDEAYALRTFGPTSWAEQSPRRAGLDLDPEKLDGSVSLQAATILHPGPGCPGGSLERRRPAGRQRVGGGSLDGDAPRIGRPPRAGEPPHPSPGCAHSAPHAGSRREARGAREQTARGPVCGQHPADAERGRRPGPSLTGRPVADAGPAGAPALGWVRTRGLCLTISWPTVRVKIPPPRGGCVFLRPLSLPPCLRPLACGGEQTAGAAPRCGVAGELRLALRRLTRPVRQRRERPVCGGSLHSPTQADNEVEGLSARCVDDQRVVLRRGLERRPHHRGADRRGPLPGGLLAGRVDVDCADDSSGPRLAGALEETSAPRCRPWSPPSAAARVVRDGVRPASAAASVPHFLYRVEQRWRRRGPSAHRLYVLSSGTQSPTRPARRRRPAHCKTTMGWRPRPSACSRTTGPWRSTFDEVFHL